MKIPERLIGYIEYDGEKIAFEFDAQEFTINLYPPQELWKKYSSPSYMFGKQKFDYTVHEWIPEGRLIGVSSSGHKVIFSIQDSPANYSGFLSYHVHWYFTCYDNMDSEGIRGFSVMGDVVDAFYSPSIELEQTYEYDEKNNISKFSVTTTNSPASCCGIFEVTDTITANFEVDAIATSGMGNHERPLFANSKFVTTFSKPVQLETIIQTYQHLIQFFMFITYRSNFVFEKVDLFVLNAEGKREYKGLLVFPRVKSIETNSDAKCHLVKYENLKEATASIFSDIKNGILSFQHYCDSFDARRSYPISRVIMILAAFERLYGETYGKDTDRSELYIMTKAQVVKLIEQYAQECTGQQRRYVNTLKDFVNNRDSSYASNVVFALKDCSEIMMPFVNRRYNGEYADIIKELGARIGVLRNGVAHCKLDFSLEPIHLSDIYIMELLLYAIELKRVGISPYEIQKAISCLFKEYIYWGKNPTN